MPGSQRARSGASCRLACSPPSPPVNGSSTRGPVGEAKLSAFAQDATLAALLWERSEELTGVTISL